MRVPAFLALWLLLPAAAAAQGDTTFTAWFRFRGEGPGALRTPAILRSPWAAGPRLSPATVVATWDSLLAASRDSLATARTTASRLRRLYRRELADTGSVTPARAGLLGLSPKYADLRIDGRARLEIRTERQRNLRCTPAELLDINSGCRSGWRAPRLDTYLQMQAGGLIGQRLHLNVDYDTERDFSARNNVQVYYEGLEDEVVRRVEVGNVTFRPPPSRFLTAAIPANNFGVNATFEVGPWLVQGIAATQKGSVVAERSYLIGNTTVQPQDREARDLDYEPNRFFWVVDPAAFPSYPAVDILAIPSGALPGATVPEQGQVRVYRYRPPSRTGIDPNLGGINAVALGADTTQRVTAKWELLQRDLDYYLDPSGLWFALVARLDPNDYLAVSYQTAAGLVGTYPIEDRALSPGGLPQDTLRLIVEPRVDATRPTFRHAMRQVYRVAGADLDRNSLKVDLTLNRSERPLRPGAAPTYLAELGLAVPTDPGVFNAQDRLFPRTRDPNADLAIREAYIVFPTLQPFADSTRLVVTERNDSLYRTPEYLLGTEGPSARFVFRLRYNASSSGDRSGLDLGALQVREGSEALYLNGRRLERGVDYSVNYDLGQVTFLNPAALIGEGSATIRATFEERGIFVVAPTQIYGLSTRYNLGDKGGVNLMGLYQVEQSAFNRPQLGFEAMAHMVGGISTDLRFKPDAVTRFLNGLTSSPATAPSRLDLNAELAFTRPDPNRSGQAYLEEFEGDPGMPLSLRESAWEFGSRPRLADGVQALVGAVFDTADATQLTWQNLVPDGAGGVVELRARDIDDRLRIAGERDQLETALFMSLHPDTAGGQVRSDTPLLRWTLPERANRPRWRSMVTALSSTGTDISRNEYLEFWVFHDNRRTADSAGVQLMLDLGAVDEDAVAVAPDSMLVLAADTVYRGRQFVGLGRLDSERQPNGVFNAATDDIGILGDRPDSLLTNSGALLSLPALCQQHLGSVVPVYRWGHLGARCTNGNGHLDTEDLDADNQLNAAGPAENVFRWVVDLRNSPYFVRDGVTAPDSSGWRLYRIPLRTPEYTLGAPNIRLVKQFRITVVAEPDGGLPDRQAFLALARMRFLGAPWVRRSDSPVNGLAGATGAPLGEVIASTVSTDNTELGYTSPPGVISGLSRKEAGAGDLGTSLNERSLRVIARGLGVGQRAEAYFRFPSGPQNLLRYGELRLWVRGRGPGWTAQDFQAFFRVGSDSRNFYQYMAGSDPASWEPELRVDLARWRALRAQVEARRLQGLPADSTARVACGGDSISTAYVLCEGPYLVHIQDPAGNPPNLARVQEMAAGIYRRAALDPTDSTEVWIDDIRLVEPISRVGTALAADARLVASDVGELSVSYIRQDGYFQQIGGEPSYRTTGTLQTGGSVRLERFLPVSLGIALPVQVNYSRAAVTPELLNSTDIAARELAGLRKPQAWMLTTSFSLRRVQRGKSWLVRGLIDPVSLSGALSETRNRTELSQGSAASRNFTANYLLAPGKGGFTLGLEGLVGVLPGFLRNSEGGKGLRKPYVNLVPSAVRLSSGLSRSESDLLSYDAPVFRPADSLLRPATSLTHFWRNSAGFTWSPLGMATLSTDLASTRDLRRYGDSTSLGRVATASRRSLLGLDAGVERDRQWTSMMSLSPRIASWLRPRYVTNSSFVLSRSLNSRDPIREDGDTAGAYILPQTLNNSRSREIGGALETGRLLSRLLGDSSGVGRTARGIRALDLSTRLTRTSTFDLAAFDPGLGYQLGLGGLGDFLRQGQDSAIGAAETRNTTLSSGADLPGGLSFLLAYGRVRTTRYQRFSGGFRQSESFQREWPRGNARLSRSLRNFPLSSFSLGTTFRATRGTTSFPTPGGTPVRTLTASSSVTPEGQLSFRNGLVVTASWMLLDQRNEANGNLTLLDQRDLNGGVSYAIPLPAAPGRMARTLRTQLNGTLARSETCYRGRGAAECQTVADTRRKEMRASLDTDLAQMVTGGLQFSYAVNEARHINRKFSQMIVTASFQLSLFAGDYR